MSSFIGEIAAVLSGVDSILQNQKVIREFVGSLYSAFQVMWCFPSLPRYTVEAEKEARTLLPDVLKLADIVAEQDVSSFTLKYKNKEETIDLTLTKQVEMGLREKVLLLLGDETFGHMLVRSVPILNISPDALCSDMTLHAASISAAAYTIITDDNGYFLGLLDYGSFSGHSLFRESQRKRVDDFLLSIRAYSLVHEDTPVMPFMKGGSYASSPYRSWRRSFHLYVVLNKEDKPVGYVSDEQIARAFDIPNRYLPVSYRR